MSERYIKKILDARIYDLVEETPLDEARILSRKLDNNLFLKREDLQSVFSFKIRGAYNKLLNLTQAQRDQGVVAASAGNHAQGVALSAKHMGLKATIVMPTTTPSIKIDAVKSYGAKVVLKGDTFDEALAYSEHLVVENGLTYVPPYDDEDVIAGQGTVGVEILRQYPKHIDAIFIAVGGGGLCAGVSAYVKTIRPKVKIIAVESEDSACLKLALETGTPQTLKEVGLFADGVSVAKIGKEPFRILQNTVDQVITISTDELCASIKDIYEENRTILEPAGALSVAGIKKYVQQTGVTGQTLIGINCGANMNFDRLRYISERTEIGEKREVVIAVTIPEEPGSFKRFCAALSKRAISEFNYRFSDGNKAHIFVGVKIESEKDRSKLIEELTNDNYAVVDLTDNEMAKLHIRHLVGGHGNAIADERLFRFEFPERPGALMTFLQTLGSRWNISLFHYRNHGAAFGRVLLGLQLSIGEGDQFVQMMDQLGYPCWDETDNPAYQLFLS